MPPGTPIRMVKTRGTAWATTVVTTQAMKVVHMSTSDPTDKAIADFQAAMKALTDTTMMFEYANGLTGLKEPVKPKRGSRTKKILRSLFVTENEDVSTNQD